MDEGQPQAAPTRTFFVSGLDSLRFVAALAVVVGHLSTNLPKTPDTAAGVLLWRTATLPANGAAAVALFFVISGFCIHLGQATSLQINATEFLLRRGMRIGLPLLFILLVAYWLGGWAAAALATVLWSVYCELFYYLCYPVLLACRRRFAMKRIFLVSTAASVLFVLAFHAHAFAFHYDLATALVYFPLWLAGAWLAERHRSDALPAAHSIAGWRMAALLLFIATNQSSHPGLQNPPWFPFAMVGWFSWHYLPRELARWQTVSPARQWERLGRASYTLYLVHILPIALLIQMSVDRPFWQLILGEAAAIAAVTFSVYVLCEQPSHRLARKLGLKTAFASPAPAPQPASA